MVLFTLAFQGCASKYSIVEFEILEPATVSFPEHVNQLLILNRAPISFDIWSQTNQEGMDERQLIMLDTAIINNLLRGVLEVMRQSPIETFHRPIWISDRRIDTTFLEDKILTKREVMEICDTLGGDAIISLELYTVGMDQHFDYYKDAPGEILNQYFEVFNRVQWNIYLPENPKPFDTYSTVDTLFFPAITGGEFISFPSGADMIRELFYKSGIKYGTYLVPAWSLTSRILYRKGDDSLKVALEHTDEGDWEAAFSIWKKLTDSTDSSLVAKSYNNMAVHYELEDKLDSASIMLNLSLEYDSLDAVKLYREELDIRLLNRKDIERQVRIR
jgi:hypothetical protein